MKQFILYVALLLAPLAADAQPDGIRSAKFLAGWQQDTGRHMAALELLLAPDWKTYWRAPGSGGIPPSFDWAGSENLGQVRLLWPRPSVFAAAGVTSIGYHDQLILPIEITPIDPNLPIVLQAKVNLGICKDICVPADLILSTALPRSHQPDPVILAALSDMPVRSAQSMRCQTAKIADGLRLTAQIDLPDTGDDAVVVFEHRNPKMWLSDTQTTWLDGQVTAVVDLVPPEAKPFELQQTDIMLTVLGKDSAIEIQGCSLP